MIAWNEHLKDVLDQVLIDETALDQRVRELAAEITEDYQRLDIHELVVIGVLRGSVLFMSDLIRRLQLPLKMDFIAMSSYTRGTKTSGQVRIIKDISESITDQHVLVVEDIVDTGLTLSSLCKLLQARQPASLRLCTLLDKPSRRQTPVHVDYSGFEIPDKFVVGYGLDYNNEYRQLPFVGVLKPEVYETVE